jgi:hypothetical protein
MNTQAKTAQAKARIRVSAFNQWNCLHVAAAFAPKRTLAIHKHDLKAGSVEAYVHAYYIRNVNKGYDANVRTSMCVLVAMCSPDLVSVLSEGQA